MHLSTPQNNFADKEQVNWSTPLGVTSGLTNKASVGADFKTLSFAYLPVLYTPFPQQAAAANQALMRPG